MVLDHVRVAPKATTGAANTGTDKTWQVASLRDIAHVSSAAFAYQSPVKCETIAGEADP